MTKYFLILALASSVSQLNFFLLLCLPFFLFCRNKQHFVFSLLMLEVMTINLILCYVMSFYSYELSLFYLVLVFFVGEAILGLALLVMIAQSKSGELLNLTIF